MIALALALPVVALPLVWRLPSAVTARAWVIRLALGVAGLWLVVLLVDADATVGRFGAGSAPAAIGTWLLVASISWPARRLPIALAVIAAGTCVGGVSLHAGGGDLSDLAGALAIAAVVAVVAARSEDDHGLTPALVAVLGAAAIAIGLVRLEADTAGFEVGGGVLAVVGAALVVVGAGSRARRAGVVLLPAAVVVGTQAAGALDEGDGLALVLAAGAVLAASRPGASIGLWALAAAVANPPAALLIGAAAVLNAAVPHPLAPIVALPGAAALATALAQEGGPARLVLAGLAVATAVRLWPRDATDDVGGRPSEPTLVAVALGTWLVLAPETWGWAPAELASWGSGVVIALVAAAVGAFVAASFTETPFALPDLEVADPVYAPGNGRWAWRLALASLAMLGLAGGALVASVLS